VLLHLLFRVFQAPLAQQSMSSALPSTYHRESSLAQPPVAAMQPNVVDAIAHAE
jgi:hypothetical protein